MTEEEAKKTRCCGPAGCGKVGDVVREFGTTVVTVERYCISSACMAWRAFYEMELVHRVDNERRAAWEGIQYDPRVERLTGKIVGGFCGLAGKP